ncbi:MAG: YbaB/EbfC family nucleoid-associated protein [Bacilli bacterium]
MNLQALMKQAQKMQKDVVNIKEEIEKETFTGESSLVKVEMNGKRELISVKIETKSNFDQDDIEMIEDMVVLSVNDAIKKINKEYELKMGNQASALGGLF